MSLPIVVSPEAQAEFDDAADWYEQQRAGLGQDFIDRVNEALGRIQSMPKMYRVVYKDMRRAPVRKFPYGIIYRVEANQIVVIAVFHGKRDPQSWQGRV